MPLLARRGFTLIELMIALVLLGMVSAGIYKVLVSNQRIYLAQTQQIELQQNLRSGAAILPSEFRELDAADNDIKPPLSATKIRIRAMRKLGFICVAPVLTGAKGQITLTVRASPVYGRNRTWASRDSVLVFYDGRLTTRNDDTWLPAELQTVTAGGTACPDSGTPNPNPGVVLSMNPSWLAGINPLPNTITRGSPVIGFDDVTYESYQAADGKWYVGYTNNSRNSGRQPIIGPLTGSNGFELAYFNSAGNPMNVATDSATWVAQIEIRLRARTAVPIRSGGEGAQTFKVDSITTRVALRNNPRCGAGALPGAPTRCS